MAVSRWIVVASIIMACATSTRSGDPRDPRALVEKAIEAMGPEEELKKHQAATWNEKGTYYGMDEKGAPFNGKYAVQWPDQFRMEIEGVFTMVLDGDKGWVKMGEETQEMDQKQLAAMQLTQKAGYLTTLLPLRDKAFKLSFAGEDTIYNRPAVAVLVERAGYPKVKIYFDVGTGLFMKSEFKSLSLETGKEILNENFVKNYKRIEGIRTPTTIMMKQDGKLFVEADIIDLKAAGTLDKSLFAKP